MPSVNRGNFTSSFPILMLFVSFPCLIDLARTSGTMLNRSGISRHSCFIAAHLKEKAFGLSHLSMPLAEAFHLCIAFVILR